MILRISVCGCVCLKSQVNSTDWHFKSKLKCLKIYKHRDSERDKESKMQTTNFRFYERILNFQNQFNVHAHQAAWLYYLKVLFGIWIGWMAGFPCAIRFFLAVKSPIFMRMMHMHASLLDIEFIFMHEMNGKRQKKSKTM